MDLWRKKTEGYSFSVCKHFMVPHLKKLDFVGGDFTLVVSLFQNKSVLMQIVLLWK